MVDTTPLVYALCVDKGPQRRFNFYSLNSFIELITAQETDRMGAVCGQPLDSGEVEYYGPPDRPRTVPTDLRQWKQALAEKASRKAEQPQQEMGTTTASTSASAAGDNRPAAASVVGSSSTTATGSALLATGGTTTTSSSSAPVPVNEVLLTPGGTKIGKLKEGDEDSRRSDALAVI